MRGGERLEHPLSSHMHRGEAMRRHSEQVAQCKPGREDSPDTNPDGTLILDFCLQKCEEIYFCCLTHLVCGVSYGNPSRPIQQHDRYSKHDTTMFAFFYLSHFLHCSSDLKKQFSLKKDKAGKKGKRGGTICSLLTMCYSYDFFFYSATVSNFAKKSHATYGFADTNY